MRIYLELNTKCLSGYKHPLTKRLKIIFHNLIIVIAWTCNWHKISEWNFYTEKGEEGNWEPRVLVMRKVDFLGTAIRLFYAEWEREDFTEEAGQCQERACLHCICLGLGWWTEPLRPVACCPWCSLHTVVAPDWNGGLHGRGLLSLNHVLATNWFRGLLFTLFTSVSVFLSPLFSCIS